MGEKAVIEILKEGLNDEYTYIPNFVPQNIKIGDIDGILFGPKGIIIIEVKSWHGQFKFACGEVYKKLAFNVF